MNNKINKFRSSFVFSSLKDKYLNLKISSKIAIYFSVIFTIATIVLNFTYDSVNKTYMTEKIKQSSFEALESAESSTNIIIDNVSNASKMIVSSDDIQSNLKNANLQMDLEIQNNINKYLTQFTNFNPNIASIYILDNYNNKYYSENNTYKSFSVDEIKNMKWYKDVLDKNGGYILKLNGGGLFHNKEQDYESYVSFIRIINDLNTQEKIGVLIININENAFYDSIVKVSNKSGTKLIIEDESNNIITKPDIDSEIFKEAEKEKSYAENKGFIIKKIDKKDYIISSIKMKNNDWNLISVSEYSQLGEQSKYIRYFILIFICVNIVLIILGAFGISRMITKPLTKLHQSMRAVKAGEFKAVDIKTYNDEVGEVKNVYNIMVFHIKFLLNKIREDEKFKRKAELDVLMSQIKPHFLYNTFDTISSLALSGENKGVYEVIKALGAFYRTSLSNGRDVITIEEEIKTIKSYLVIQNVRYKNKFEVQYNLEQNCNNFRIIKLVLQPLVENAIYHGLRNKADKGLIKISTYEEVGKVILEVEDNGIGIDEEKLKNINENNTTGIGVRATKERLRVFYGEECKFIVTSKKDIGTKIVIEIPKKDVS
ncbi:histidine kinase [Clostridium zeae]|uniref:histidine kinase n=1 Tax=Clostridium zeae TaxID=2759022 RepID=A0ABQ1EGK9_9CLOT|nr:sensor histidine kinase [Clostridium zeae]GFZ33890.1 histidine kinase [Clostridium zeae]